MRGRQGGTCGEAKGSLRTDLRMCETQKEERYRLVLTENQAGHAGEVGKPFSSVQNCVKAAQHCVGSHKPKFRADNLGHVTPLSKFSDLPPQ